MFDLLNSDLESLIDIVLFLLPGFLTVLFFQYLIPRREKSDLQTIVFSVAASVFLSYAAGMIFGSINLITNLNLSIKPNQTTFGLVSLSIGLIVAFYLSKYLESNQFTEINEKLFGRRPFGRVWTYFLKEEPNTTVKVFTDNKIYVGIIKQFSFDPSDDIQELELWKPMYLDPITRKIHPITESETVLLEGSSIVSIEKIIPNKAQELYPKLKQ